MVIRTGLGQDSHRFLASDSRKPCVIAGIIFEDIPGFNAHSDGDVVFHAICNAITSLTGEPLLGTIAEDLCLKDGITDSEVYVKEGLTLLREKRQKIVHVALSLEGMRPKLGHAILQMRQNTARVLEIEMSQVGITATTGAGLTDFGCGDGLQCLALLTTKEDRSIETQLLQKAR